jgi:hypothetical protein
MARPSGTLLLVLCLGGLVSACSGPPGAGAGGTTGPELDAATGGDVGQPGPGTEGGSLDAGRSGQGTDGGTSGHGGTDGGMPGEGGTDGGRTSDGGCPGVFCDDFETSSAGQAPRAPWTVDVSSAHDGTVVVDSTVNHTPNGAKALELSVVANPAPANAVWAFAELSGAPVLPLTTMYGRMWVRFDQLASNSTSYFHVNNIEASGLLSDNSTTATDTLGMYYYQGINTQVGYTTTKADGSSGLDDAYSPNGGSMPYTTPAVNTWICYEWMFGPPDLLDIWFDGTEVISVDQQALTSSGQSDWPAPVQFGTLEIGWAQWWNSTVPTNMWVDDVVIGTSRIGCQ